MWFRSVICRDVVAEGDEPFMDAMRINFERARQLYTRKLRPVLRRSTPCVRMSCEPRLNRIPKASRFVPTIDRQDAATGSASARSGVAARADRGTTVGL